MPDTPTTCSACITVEQHLTRLLEAQARRLDDRITTLQATIDKTEAQLDRRLEGMNEFRATIRDTTELMATRQHVDTVATHLGDKIHSLENSRAYSLGVVAGSSALVATVVSVIGYLMR